MKGEDPKWGRQFPVDGNKHPKVKEYMAQQQKQNLDYRVPGDDWAKCKTQNSSLMGRPVVDEYLLSFTSSSFFLHHGCPIPFLYHTLSSFSPIPLFLLHPPPNSFFFSFPQ